MAILLVQALVNLTDANEELGFDPRTAFIRAFSQVLSANAQDVALLAER
jgi:hypothetical protein